jgi:hypothetical protein
VVWRYTPRQLAAFLFITRRRQKRSMAERLSIQALAASGDTNAINKKLRDLEK